jgi:hypothetical protein
MLPGILGPLGEHVRGLAMPVPVQVAMQANRGGID